MISRLKRGKRSCEQEWKHDFDQERKICLRRHFLMYQWTASCFKTFLQAIGSFIYKNFLLEPVTLTVSPLCRVFTKKTRNDGSAIRRMRTRSSKFYYGGSIFEQTGFTRKLLTEKLLGIYLSVNRICIFMHSKRGKNTR
ncbi:hypothetical protein V1478_004230 [Vespula squamosa]|uniref:Uncharacterized protein n=1 Tax=Vespula squamosa TaxID=30214 RepID=A0ABD2BKE5_VESSQ